LGREKALGQRAVNDEGRVIGLRDPRFAPTHPRFIVAEFEACPGLESGLRHWSAM